MKFRGFVGRDCGDHKGWSSQRAFCADCGEWCSVRSPCVGCRSEEEQAAWLEREKQRQQWTARAFGQPP